MEKLILYTMKPEMGPPETQEFAFPDKDLSWEQENKIFFDKIIKKDYSTDSIKNALYIMKIIEKIYKQNKII
jgi:hypothetical protein